MALVIIGVILVVVSAAGGVLWAFHGKHNNYDDVTGKYILTIVLVNAGLLMVMLGEETVAYRNALDGKNPYVKEYRYKAMPDGEMVVVDSVYVRVE